MTIIPHLGNSGFPKKDRIPPRVNADKKMQCKLPRINWKRINLYFGACLLIFSTTTDGALFGGVNMDLGLQNVGDFDLVEIKLQSDNNLSIVGNGKLFAVPVRGPARGSTGYSADNGREVPKTFVVQWSEVQYVGKDIRIVQKPSVTIHVADRIPEDVINAARGRHGDRLSIVLCIGTDRVYLQWALWSRSHSREPLRAGGDDIPPVSPALTALYALLYYGPETAQAKKILQDASQLGIDVNRRILGKPALLHVLEKQTDGWYIYQLLDAGANPNLKDFMGGFTPLMLAAGNASPEIVKALLAHGADVHARNTNHDTALHYAASAGQLENVKLLLKHGADPNVVNQTGHSPLREAQMQGFTEIMLVLKAAGAK